MLPNSARDGVVFVTASIILAAMAARLVQACLCASRRRRWSLADVRSLTEEVGRILHSVRNLPCDEVDSIVQKQMQEVKVKQFRRTCQMICFIVLPLTCSLMISIGNEEVRVATLAQDIIHLFVQGVSAMTLLCPWLVTERTLDLFYVFYMLSIAVYASPWVCPQQIALQAIGIAHFTIFTMTMVRRSFLKTALMNLLVTMSTCALVLGGDSLVKPYVLAAGHVLVVTVITVSVEMFNRAVASMIRSGLEMQATKELLSAASGLLRSCCDVVVELDSEGAIVGKAADLGSFLLRGPGSNMHGTPLVNLMPNEEDKKAFTEKMGDPRCNELGLAEVRHVHMKDGNSNSLGIELLWFQFRTLNQKLRYMVGLREFPEPVAAHGTAAERRARAAEEAAAGSPEAPEAPRPIAPPPVVADAVEEKVCAEVTVDCTEAGYPVRVCSSGFSMRIGRISPGQPFTGSLKSDTSFSTWVQLAINLAVYDREKLPDCRVTFVMPQGEMRAKCGLALDYDSSESNEVIDLHHVVLIFSDIHRKGSRVQAAGSSRRNSATPPPERSRLRGTPVTRFTL